MAKYLKSFIESLIPYNYCLKVLIRNWKTNTLDYNRFNLGEHNDNDYESNRETEKFYRWHRDIKIVDY